jgi:hypothetical protein
MADRPGGMVRVDRATREQLQRMAGRLAGLLERPVSMAETVRAMLVVAETEIDTVVEAIRGGGKPDA